jgi:hypothetical protein
LHCTQPVGAQRAAPLHENTIHSHNTLNAKTPTRKHDSLLQHVEHHNFTNAKKSIQQSQKGNPMNPYTKPEILETMQTHTAQFTAYLENLSPEQFFAGTPEKWGAALQTQHLSQTLGMIAKALTVPDRLPPAPEAKARTFDQIKAAYNQALGGGVTLSGNMLPTLEPKTDVAYQLEVIGAFKQTVAAFSSNLSNWTEDQLDSLGMKHPLMGLNPAREMMIFAIYHNTHHEAGIKKFLGGI